MNELTPKEKLINLLNEKKVQFKEINKKWREDYDIDLIAVQLQFDNFSLISDNLKNNKEIALAAVKTHGATLSYLNEELKNNYDIVLHAVSHSGDALEFASYELKNNKKIGFTAMKQNKEAFEYSSTNLQYDKELLEFYINNQEKTKDNHYFYLKCEDNLKIINEAEWLNNNLPIHKFQVKHRKF